MTRLLVVEDDQDFAETLAEVFEAAGYSVKTADDGLKGLEVYRQWRPQVVITDLVMPQLEGIGLIKEIRTQDASSAIIAISGGGEHPPPGGTDLIKGYLDNARDEGAALAYAKPVNFLQMLREVAALTQGPAVV